MPPERVILVGVGLKSEAASQRLLEAALPRDNARSASVLASSLDELERLVETAGGVVVGTVSQSLDRYHPATLIGSGKMLQLAEAVRREDAATVVFDREIAPAQQKNLELGVRAKIIDRTRLILDIFARRARTSEGRLQVELAQLSYLLPRLTGAWRSYSQQVGGIGTRGPGERQLEYERRHIQYRILHLRQDLERIRRARFVRRQRRLAVPVPQVALIGYTNVGKSSMLNALTETAAATRRSRAVYADDKLFATLDPTARRVRMPEGSWIVVSDTVGFIRRLPTALIAAFRSTLEEAALADCLLVVSDASSQETEAQLKAVEATLKELDAQDVLQVRLFNKADLIDEDRRRDLTRRFPGSLLVSAATGEGLPEALAAVQELLSRRWLLRELELPAQRAYSQAHAIHACSQVLSQTAAAGKVRFRLRLTAENWDRLQKKLVATNKKH